MEDAILISLNLICVFDTFYCKIIVRKLILTIREITPTSFGQIRSYSVLS